MNKKTKKDREEKDCIYFGEKYLKHYLDKKTSEFHRDMIELIENEENERIDILAPRGHAKSTWLSIIYPSVLYQGEENILDLSCQFAPSW